VERSGAIPKSIILKGGTGKDHEAFFCETCGTYVWSRYQVAPGGEALFVRAGTLDTPDAVTPDVHLFTRSKLPWIKLPENALAFETGYKVADVWPADKKERARRNAAAQG